MRCNIAEPREARRISDRTESDWEPGECGPETFSAFQVGHVHDDTAELSNGHLHSRKRTQDASGAPSSQARRCESAGSGLSVG